MTRLPNPPVVKQGLSVSYFRQLIQYLRESRIIAGQGMKVSRTPNGTVLDCTAKGGGGTYVAAAKSLRPFAVRWFAKPTQANPDAGEWQIYLPYGCATINSRFGTDRQQALACIPMNDAATDADDEEIYGWYSIPEPRDADAYTYTSDGHKILAWNVTVYAGPWPTMEISTKKKGDAVEHPFYTETVGYLILDESRDGEGNIVRKRSADQYRETGLNIYRTDSDVLGITYKTEDDVTDKDAEWKPYLTRQSFTFSNTSLSIQDDTDISGFSEVVVHIIHEDEDFEVEIIDAEDAEENDDDNTYISIYTMEDDVAVSDNRSRITNTPWYNS